MLESVTLYIGLGTALLTDSITVLHWEYRKRSPSDSATLSVELQTSGAQLITTTQKTEKPKCRILKLGEELFAEVAGIKSVQSIHPEDSDLRVCVTFHFVGFYKSYKDAAASLVKEVFEQ